MSRKGVITFAGNPLTLLGTEIKVGDIAPDFTASITLSANWNTCS